MKLRDFVIDERTKQGKTIKEFAETVGITAPVLGQVEKGYVPKERTIGKILVSLGYSYSQAKEFIEDI